MNEVWKDIKGYEGFYQVSNLGRVKSVDRLVHTEANGIKIRLSKGQILNAGKKNWYRTVALSKYGVPKSFLVHRLVAEAVEKTGISHIGCAASGKRKSAGGYIWKFA